METIVVSREFSEANDYCTQIPLAVVRDPESQLCGVRVESGRKGQQESCWSTHRVVKYKDDEDSS